MVAKPCERSKTPLPNQPFSTLRNGAFVGETAVFIDGGVWWGTFGRNVFRPYERLRDSVIL